MKKSDILRTIKHYKQAGTEKIGIYTISEKGRLQIQELHLNLGGVIKYRRLKQLNKRGEGIYFTPEDDCCNMLFLDDPECLENLPHNTLVIETSPGKYQLHIPICGPAQNKETRSKFQKLLCETYYADVGATYANHLRRLPGFHNQKYKNKPEVNIAYIVTGGKPLRARELMEATEKAKISDEIKEEYIKPSRRHTPPPTGLIRKSWGDFYDDGDRSRADMRYTLYLLRMGMGEADIRTKLLQESLDISERKIGHLDDYVDRTIRRASEYIS